MPETIFFSAFVEDALHENILRKTLQDFPSLEIDTISVTNGYAALQKGFPGYNAASEYAPYLVMTDLDNTTCPAKMLAKWLPSTPKHPNLLFSIAVREADAWVLADRAPFAAFLGVAQSKIPLRPEEISNPKELLITIARNSSKRDIREGLVPNGSARTGKLYNTLLGKFIDTAWDPKRAQSHAPSLARFLQRLSERSQSA
ncbi:MAG: hypothetical protein ACOVSW_09340 [Candidatus Kapaibacteriota bacterium]